MVETRKKVYCFRLYLGNLPSANSSSTQKAGCLTQQSDPTRSRNIYMCVSCVFSPPKAQSGGFRVYRSRDNFFKHRYVLPRLGVCVVQVRMKRQRQSPNKGRIYQVLQKPDVLYSSLIPPEGVKYVVFSPPKVQGGVCGVYCSRNSFFKHR